MNKTKFVVKRKNAKAECSFDTFDLALQYAEEKKRDGCRNVSIVAVTETVIETEIMSL